MKELVPMNDYGIFASAKYEAMVDSRFIAEIFEKEHYHVLRDIAKITDTKSGLSEGFIKQNFCRDTYKDSTGRKLPCYRLTRNGFVILVMGYTGEKAMHFKELYIKRFNEMEEQIKYLQSLREQHPQLTAAINSMHETPKFYHYSNEMDMLNKIALGMTAKQFREAHNISNDEPIRPHLTSTQIALLDLLQNFDIGFVIAIPDFQQRKQLLEYQAMKFYCECEETHHAIMEAPCNLAKKADDEKCQTQ